MFAHNTVAAPARELQDRERKTLGIGGLGAAAAAADKETGEVNKQTSIEVREARKYAPGSPLKCFIRLEHASSALSWLGEIIRSLDDDHIQSGLLLLSMCRNWQTIWPGRAVLKVAIDLVCDKTIRVGFFQWTYLPVATFGSMAIN